MSAEKILIADDDESVLFLLHALLKKNGFKVLEAENGMEALKIAQKKLPKVVILDTAMPLLNGVETCRRLKDSDWFNGKILMLSSHHTPQDQVTGLEAGASDYIPKPFDEDVLVAKVRAALRDLKNRTPDKDKPPCICKGEFKLEENTRTLWLNGQKVCDLTEIQYQIMRIFLLKSPDVVSRQELFKEIFGDRSHDIKLVDIHLYHLKQRLGRACNRLKNVYGRGYVLTA